MMITTMMWKFLLPKDIWVPKIWAWELGPLGILIDRYGHVSYITLRKEVVINKFALYWMRI